MQLGIAGLAVAAMAVFAHPVAAKDKFPNEIAAQEKAVKLGPISPWNIDYAESRCRLARLFGSEESRHLIFFEQASPSRAFTLTVGGPELQRFHRTSAIDLGMENDEPMERLERIVRSNLGDFGPALIIQGKRIDDEPLDQEQAEENVRTQRSLRQIDLAEAEAIDRLVLARGNRVVSFETGNMKAPFEALNQCTRSLIEMWGLDPAQHDLYTPVKWDNQLSVAKRLQQNYPLGALRKGESGIFRLRVIVEADGTMSECHLDNATITESLVSPACREMERAVFEPALDKDGKPMRSHFSTRIVYQVN